jgi:hypothetical protein
MVRKGDDLTGWPYRSKRDEDNRAPSASPNGLGLNSWSAMIVGSCRSRASEIAGAETFFLRPCTFQLTMRIALTITLCERDVLQRLLTSGVVQHQSLDAAHGFHEANDTSSAPVLLALEEG